MKKLLIILVAIFGITTIKAQQPSVERSIWGVQVGGLTVRAYNETRLSNNIALRVEAGYVGNALMSFSLWHFVAYPEISVQPRFYYNLQRRHQNGRVISNNAADFLTLNIFAVPRWGWVASDDAGDIIGGVGFAPMWGMRRNLDNHFKYELGAGVGYIFGFDGGSGVLPRLHFRIGYRF